MRLYKRIHPQLGSSDFITYMSTPSYVGSYVTGGNTVHIPGEVSGNFMYASCTNFVVPKDGLWYYWEMALVYGSNCTAAILGGSTVSVLSNKGVAARYIGGFYEFRTYAYGSTIGVATSYTTSSDVVPAIFISPCSYSYGTINILRTTWSAPPSDITVHALSGDVPVAPLYYTNDGVIAELGGYRLHSYADNGTFTLAAPTTVEYLLVAGGGGGGGGTYHGAAGGAGGFLTGSALLAAGSYSIGIGNGGAGGFTTFYGDNGGDTTFNSLTAIGGGGGGNYSSTGGRSGGSGGGGCRAHNAAGLGVVGQGYPGGVGSDLAPNYWSGSGGGAGGAGVNGGSGGIGGIGRQSSISGTATYYAGGGGAAGYLVGTSCPGGNGGGGAGGYTGHPSGYDGVNGTGGGGGGTASHTSGKGGNGGKGIAIIRYII